MVLGDLKSKGGVSKLNEHLSQRNYIEGHHPSQTEVPSYDALSGAPPHAARWYRHIGFISPTEPSAFVRQDGAAAASKAAENGDDGDNEAKKARQERLQVGASATLGVASMLRGALPP
ncbi:hypothetical protein HPB48_009164 [Haemaphysalis longicornis]|uniref:Uncharacterized protein n=1 Tax=Haemaphysalis longicornis TaxID=44386 RepID=A0A9J6GME9_HAELO|nr:hypothetical protein HPB48_009164 [Haemaphysalis longicornis]